MDNRLPQDNDEERVRQEIQRRINAILDCTALLYSLMEPGMTVDVSLEEPPSIITPGFTPQIKRLLITRPAAVLNVKG